MKEGNGHGRTLDPDNAPPGRGCRLAGADGRSPRYVVYARAKERRALAELDDRMLRDIGIDYATARNEIDKFFWER